MEVFTFRALFLLSIVVLTWHSITANDNHGRQKRVIGGTKVKLGEYPWIASIKVKEAVNKIWFLPVNYRIMYCTASLISDKHILTAAHCVTHDDGTPMKPGSIHVRLGDTEFKKSFLDNIKGTLCKLDFLSICDPEDVKYFMHASKVTIHPNYDPSSKWKNDIAIIDLTDYVPSSSDDEAPHIVSVNIDKGTFTKFPNSSDECYFQGWGCTENGGGINNNAMHIKLKVLSNQDCFNIWHSDVSVRLCAGGNNDAKKGICSGDSGGPLVCSKNGIWYQVGIASFTDTNRPGVVPGVFTRVSAFAKWIQQVIS